MKSIIYKNNNTILLVDYINSNNSIVIVAVYNYGFNIINRLDNETKQQIIKGISKL